MDHVILWQIMEYIPSQSRQTRNHQILKVALDSSIYALGKVLDVSTVQSSHRYTTIHSHVHVRLLSQGLALLGLETSEPIR